MEINKFSFSIQKEALKLRKLSKKMEGIKLCYRDNLVHLISLYCQSNVPLTILHCNESVDKADGLNSIKLKIKKIIITFLSPKFVLTTN